MKDIPHVRYTITHSIAGIIQIKLMFKEKTKCVLKLKIKKKIKNFRILNKFKICLKN